MHVCTYACIFVLCKVHMYVLANMLRMCVHEDYIRYVHMYICA